MHYVGDTDKVSTLGEAAEVDNIAVLSIDVLVVNNTAAHVDESAVDHTVDTFERQADLRGGRIGLEGHLDIVGNRIDTDTSTDFGEDKLNGVVFGKVAEGVSIGVGILLLIIINTESGVTDFLFSIPRLNFDTVDIAMGNTATVGTDTVDGDRRTFGRIQLHATDFFASIDSATILGAVALNIDVTLLLLLNACQHPDTPVKLQGETQGTYYSIIYYDSLQRNLQPQIDSVLNLIDCTVSLWNDNSLIRRINNGQDSLITPLFHDLLSKSRSIRQYTHGAFDCRIGSYPLRQSPQH